MTAVIYIEHNGTRHKVDVPNGDSVMQGAVNNGVPGIVGECGGANSCATCRCTVDTTWAAKLGNPTSGAEKELIEGAEGEYLPNMRLTCQIEVSPELDGLIVHLPEKQF